MSWVFVALCGHFLLIRPIGLIRSFGLISEYHLPVLENVDESTGESSGFLKVDSQKMGLGQEIAFHCDPVLTILIDHLELVSAIVPDVHGLVLEELLAVQGHTAVR